MDSENKEINLLLLGETGVGKSTFINSFINYVENSSLEEALKQENLSILIPAKFTIVDNNDQAHEIKEGKDNNEDANIGNSSTQTARSYKFNLEDGTLIRFIDTPGIGDSRGIEQDKKNFDFILSHLSAFDEIHAICFLLKPNVTVLTPFFKFCILELLTHLEKSAADNIVFIFTNGRGTDYRPGDSIALIKSLLGDIEKNNNIKIKCEIKGPKRNVFCFDNEGFRYVLAKKRNIQYGTHIHFKHSWDKATTECWSLINYIRGSNTEPALKPHNIKGTISINQARKVIMTLAKPLADIADNIEDNLLSMNRHKGCLLSEQASLEELKSILFVPVTSIVETQLDAPVTVCTSQKCLEIYTVFGINKYHYKQRCHNPCYLKNVPKEVIGSPDLLYCAAMGRTTRCLKCTCDYSTHMHIYYETKAAESKEEDKTVLTRMSSSQDVIRKRDKIIAKLVKKSDELEQEKSTISRLMAQFALFLRTNSICPINDAYMSYLEYLIEREENLGNRSQKDLLVRYKQLKKEHMQLLSIFENSDSTTCDSFNAEDVIKSVQTLYSLKHTGNIIQKLHNKQERGFSKEHGENVEYHHNKLIKSQNQHQNQMQDFNRRKGEICRLLRVNKLHLAKDKMDELVKNYGAQNIPPDNNYWNKRNNYNQAQYPNNSNFASENASGDRNGHPNQSNFRKKPWSQGNPNKFTQNKSNNQHQNNSNNCRENNPKNVNQSNTKWQHNNSNNFSNNQSNKQQNSSMVPKQTENRYSNDSHNVQYSEVWKQSAESEMTENHEPIAQATYSNNRHVVLPNQSNTNKWQHNNSNNFSNNQSNKQQNSSMVPKQTENRYSNDSHNVQPTLVWKQGAESEMTENHEPIAQATYSNNQRVQPKKFFTARYQNINRNQNKSDDGCSLM